MAVDRALLAAHAQAGGPPTLRFYQWDRPTLSLGAGQRWPREGSAAGDGHPPVAVVRRPTGGRAALHGGDLTYSLIAGQREGFPASVTGVYRRLRAGLARGLAKLGIAPETGGGKAGADDFRCFARAGAGDLIWRGRKYLGSAQLWQGRSFLQHGSLLLQPQTDLWARLGWASPGREPAITCLAEMLPGETALAAVKAALRAGLEEELGVRFAPGGLSAWEQHWLAREGEGPAAPALPGSQNSDT